MSDRAKIELTRAWIRESKKDAIAFTLALIIPLFFVSFSIIGLEIGSDLHPYLWNLMMTLMLISACAITSRQIINAIPRWQTVSLHKRALTQLLSSPTSTDDPSYDPFLPSCFVPVPRMLRSKSMDRLCRKLDVTYNLSYLCTGAVTLITGFYMTEFHTTLLFICVGAISILISAHSLYELYSKKSPTTDNME